MNTNFILFGVQVPKIVDNFYESQKISIFEMKK